jgi:hypothetical protein
MATVNPSVWTVTNTTQDLFLITYPFPNVPSFDSAGTIVKMVYDDTPIDNGNDISIIPNGSISLQPDVIYSITVRSDIINGQGFYQVFSYDEDLDTYTAVSSAVPIGNTLTCTVAPSVATEYFVRTFTANGNPWQYPSQLRNTYVTVQAISGYEQ